MQVRCKCQFCNVECDEQELILKHIFAEHINHLFDPVKEASTLPLKEKLPDGIYRCEFCHSEIAPKYFTDTQAAINRHLRMSCPSVTDNTAQSPILIKSRTELEKELLESKACKLCNAEFLGTHNNEMLAHYKINHQHRILALLR